MIRLLGAVAAAARRTGLRGAARAAVRVADAVLLRVRRPPLTAHVDGATIRGFLRHRSFLAEAMRPRETYAELFQRLLQKGMTVVDGGAHVGLYTVLAARVVGPTGFVIALEPDLYNLAALRVNVDRAGGANVEVVPEALADAAGTARFYETRSTIGSSLIERDDAGVRVVRTTSIDLLLRGREVSTLLVKLNIEGAEPLALAGMRDVLPTSSRWRSSSKSIRRCSRPPGRTSEPSSATSGRKASLSSTSICRARPASRSRNRCRRAICSHGERSSSRGSR